MPARLLGACALLLACQSTPSDPPADTSVDAVDVVIVDDVSTDVAVESDGGGGACSFNRDCIAAERCACDETTGCRCAPGPRGTGLPGVTACTSGDDCASALCVEATAGSLCSDACATDGDCPAALPRCLSIPGVGDFCARAPSADAGAATTALTATFGARTATFTRAQYGVLAGGRLVVEAHAGGDPACPTETSPTPLRTLSLRGIDATATAPQTAGLTAVLFDFSGDLTDAPLLRASAVTVTRRSFAAGVSVSLDLAATFPGGTITGTLTATHCDSLDD